VILEDEGGEEVEETHDGGLIKGTVAPVLDYGVERPRKMRRVEELHQGFLPAEGRNCCHKKISEVPDAALANQVMIEPPPVKEALCIDFYGPQDMLIRASLQVLQDAETQRKELDL
jgi:hypothetical protein